MNRFSDGKFQPNVDENAVITKLNSFLHIGAMPDYMLKAYIEFTPIDICANSVIKLIQNPTKQNRIFHLYDFNHVDIGDFIGVVRKRIPFGIVSHEEFIKKVNKLLRSPDSSKLLGGILRDFDENQKLANETKIKIKSDFSIKYLQKIGFVWPKIDEGYLNRFLDYFKSIGYMDL